MGVFSDILNYKSEVGARRLEGEFLLQYDLWRREHPRIESVEAMVQLWENFFTAQGKPHLVKRAIDYSLVYGCLGSVAKLSGHASYYTFNRFPETQYGQWWADKVDEVWTLYERKDARKLNDMFKEENPVFYDRMVKEAEAQPFHIERMTLLRPFHPKR